MSLFDLFTDTLTLIPTGISDVPDGQGGFTRNVNPAPSGSTANVPCRIEVGKLHNSGRRILSEQGDVPMATHVCYLRPYLLNPDGSQGAAIVLNVDDHVQDQNGADYMVVAPPYQAKNRTGVHHLEVELIRVGGSE